MKIDVRRALLAGLAGGALAGLVDGTAAVLAGGAGVKRALLPMLPLLGAGLGALFGAALAGAFALLSTALSRVNQRRAPVLAAVLLAAPVVVYDALAMFAGAQAKTIPFRHGLSVLAIVLGLGAVALATTLYRRALLAERWQRRGLALAGVGLAAVAFAANRVVLPRLYPWFHATLALFVIVVLVLAARAALNAPGPRQFFVTLGAVVVAFAVGYVLVGRSQGLRFVAHQRTQMIGLGLAALPRPPGSPARPVHHVKRDESPLPEGPHRPQSDVVIVTIDALRPDHVGAYGYGRKTTPNIDALAARGVRFTRAYTSAPNTSFASASMLTGKYYPTLARLGAPDGQDTLPLLLRRYAWKTAAFYPPAVFYIAGDQLKAYRDSNFHFEYVKVGDFSDAETRVTQITDFLAAERPPRVFMWVHFFEPHEPYDRWPGHDFGRADKDRYDTEVAYVDKAVGRLLDHLARHRPNAIVILTADHGEEFDEHGGRYHGTTLYEEQVRVPLIIAVPGLKPQVIEGPVELVDIAPTILGLLDIPIPLRMRGTDLGPWLGTPPPPSERLPPAFAEVHDLRMVATAADKLICDTKLDLCSYFDLKSDPGEKRNQADTRGDRVAALRTELDGWLEDNAALEGSPQQDAPTGPAARALERARLGDPGAAAGIAALLTTSASLPVRREAARLLVTNLPPRKETESSAVAAARDPDAEVAGWARVAAARLGDPTSRQRLLAALQAPKAATTTAATPCDQLRVFAAIALGSHGERAAVPTLAAALGACSDTKLSADVVATLKLLRDPRATEALIGHLPVVVGRRDVVAALGAISDPGSIPALAERLRSDEYVPVRIEAAGALASIGGAPARAALAEAARAEREPTVKAAIRDALSRAR